MAEVGIGLGTGSSSLAYISRVIPRTLLSLQSRRGDLSTQSRQKQTSQFVAIG